ncbi:MAG: hypothetical protein QMB24_17125 [Spirosomataceae bacterium]
MTFRVHFFADQAFFSMIKKLLDDSPKHSVEQKFESEIQETATCIIICHSACEAFLNILFNFLSLDNFEDFERKSIIDKANILYEIKGQSVDWSKNPLQDMRQLEKVRNWLTHFKDANVGLINSMGHWVVDKVNKRPKINDYQELKFSRVQRYYDNCREILYELCTIYGVEEDFEYLESEEYQCYLVG